MIEVVLVLAGVVGTVFVQRASKSWDNNEWLRRERLSAHTSFLTSLETTRDLFRRNARGKARGVKMDHVEMREELDKLVTSYSRLRLLSSDDIATPARESMQLVRKIPSTDHGTPEFEELENAIQQNGKKYVRLAITEVKTQRKPKKTTGGSLEVTATGEK